MKHTFENHYLIEHSCKHNVYWDTDFGIIYKNGPITVTFAQAMSRHPCPWCGGEKGYNPPKEDSAMVEPIGMARIVRE